MYQIFYFSKNYFYKSNMKNSALGKSMLKKYSSQQNIFWAT